LDSSAGYGNIWKLAKLKSSEADSSIGGRQMTIRGTKITVRPGEIVPDSGIYEEIDTGQRATLVKGEHAPPTQNKNSAWKQVIDTNPDN
jgi:hypothetical protein